MAKEVSKVVKLQVKGGAANPSPPVGPALGAAGVNIMEFCKQFNARTQDKPGKVLPVQITVYKDKSFDFVVKTPRMIYAIETNFYSSSGSKLNETARSYKTLAIETATINGFEFVWFTDGKGWMSARNNLEEIFDIMEHIYSIDDMETGVMTKLFV